jgi:site-specific DNA-methyltransferase (adenine-specific)
MNLINADCIAAMKEMDDNSVDSIVTDPPYELGFMGKSWDASGIAFNLDVWREALRVLKPGGHLIAFSGSRTYHRMAVAIEDAGFEIRDQIMWVYGSGFPKSHNISKGIDKAAGLLEHEAGDFRIDKDGTAGYAPKNAGDYIPPEPQSAEAKQWQGWGTALKPAHEPMVLARKPVIGTVANNVLTYGVGGLNIDGSRVNPGERVQGGGNGKASKGSSWNGDGDDSITREKVEPHFAGRFPANFIHDGSDEVVDLLGEPARFFYCAKASKRDRNEGLDGFEGKEIGAKGNGLARKCATCSASVIDGCECVDRTFINPSRANHHPTVKPTTLMQYLVRLVTPPNGTVLDPFMGSGSTGKACAYEGFDFIGIEQSSEYVEIAQARIEYARGDKK